MTSPCSPTHCRLPNNGSCLHSLSHSFHSTSLRQSILVCPALHLPQSRVLAVVRHFTSNQPLKPSLAQRPSFDLIVVVVAAAAASGRCPLPACEHLNWQPANLASFPSASAICGGASLREQPPNCRVHLYARLTSPTNLTTGSRLTPGAGLGGISRTLS